MIDPIALVLLLLVILVAVGGVWMGRDVLGLVLAILLIVVVLKLLGVL